MKYVHVTIAIATTLLLSGVAVAGGPPGSAAQCRASRACVAVELDADLSRGPRVDKDLIEAESGAFVDLFWAGERHGAVVIRFQGQSPFTNGRRTIVLNHRSSKHLQLIEVDQRSEFKYTVIDKGNPRRPVLDPVIIIKPPA